jgi:hypothetical protein
MVVAEGYHKISHTMKSYKGRHDRQTADEKEEEKVMLIYVIQLAGVSLVRRTSNEVRQLALTPRTTSIGKIAPMLPLISQAHLLVLDTATPRTLSSLNALLVRLDLTTTHSAHHATARLPWPGQIAGCGLSEKVDLDEVALKCALEGDDGLDKERVRVLHVDVHDGHHANAHKLGLEELAHLLEIVGFDGGGNELGLFAGTHRGWLDVFDDGHVWVVLVLWSCVRPEVGFRGAASVCDFTYHSSC